MATFAINKDSYEVIQHEKEENFFNPIKNHLKKGCKKSKPICQQTPVNHVKEVMNSQKEMRFRDLSKDKMGYFTDLNKNLQPVKQNSFKDLIKNHQQTKFSQVRRKLQYQNNSTDTQRNKSLTFTEIIRTSRQKKLRQESKSKQECIIKDKSQTPKQGKVFNVLKNRLMGQNNPLKSNISIKQQEQTYNFNQKYSNQQLDMVRISTQLQFTQIHTSLDMNPHL